MKIKSEKEGTELTVVVEGSINAATAAELENELQTQCEGITKLILDFADVGFVSSAGIRVILWAYKRMNAHGTMTLQNVNENVREIFDLVGLTTVLNFA